MQAKYRWLLLPPALALVLFLGPLRPPAEVDQPATTSGQEGAGIPALPDIGQVACTLIGVLLLGAVGVIVFSRLSARHRGPSGGILALRQSLRLSGRHSVHALQFDDSVLLLGECDGNLSVLSRMPDAELGNDERRIAERDEDDEDGAIPRDLVIPRPPRSPSRKKPPPAVARQKDFQALLKLARKGR